MIAWILFGVLLLVVGYFVYTYFTGGADSMVQKTYLKTQAADIPLSNYASPNSVRCAYSFWLFVNRLDAVDVAIITVASPSATAPELAVRLTPEAKMVVDVGGSSYQAVEDFPLQKWSRIDLSFDNNVHDIFMDGRLYRSFKMGTSLNTTSTSIIKFGMLDAYLAGFARQSSPMDPSSAWSNYISGNRSLSVGTMPSYGVDVMLTKNNEPQKRVTLF